MSNNMEGIECEHIDVHYEYVLSAAGNEYADVELVCDSCGRVV